MKKRSQVLETVVHGVFLLLGLITVGCVLLISVYLIVSGIPAIRKIGLVPFLFGKTWASTAAEPSYGILPFILTSVYGTAGAIVLGVPLGFLTAVYLAKVAPPRLKTVLESAVSLLAGIPAIRKIGLVPFLFGKTWKSTGADPSYGILPFILTSVYGTAGAIVLGVPVGFLTAVYLAKAAPPRIKAVLSAAVSLLAGIPSVVYGLVGMLILVPGIRKIFGVADGASLLAAMIVLAIMILPSIIKVSVTALEAVPPEYEDASLALGATAVVRTRTL